MDPHASSLDCIPRMDGRAARARAGAQVGSVYQAYALVALDPPFHECADARLIVRALQDSNTAVTRLSIFNKWARSTNLCDTHVES